MAASTVYFAKPDMNEDEFANLDAQYRSAPPAGPTWELISLSVYGGAEDLRFAAVWALRLFGTHAQEVHIVWRSGVKAIVTLLDLRDFTPQIVATTNGADDVLFVIVFRKRRPDEPRALLDYDVAKSDLKAKAIVKKPEDLSLLQRRRVEDYRIGWASTYGVTPKAADAAYAIVWYPQVSKVAANGKPTVYKTVPWTVETDLGSEDANERFFAHVEGFSRLHLSIPYCSLGTCDKPGDLLGFGHASVLPDYSIKYMTVWYGDMVGAWAAGGALSVEECKSLLSSPPQGTHPIRVMASGPADDPVFVVIFAQTDLPKTKRGTVVKPFYKPNPFSGKKVPIYADLDDWIIDLMQKNGIRRLQLALTGANKLIAVRAYSNIENFYQGGALTLHDTPFRLASVSKTLTAFALMKLYSDGNLGPAGLNPFDGITLDSLLGWSGSWKYHTLRDILTHVNGVRLSPNDPSDASYRNAWNAQLGVSDVSLPIDDPLYYQPLLQSAPLADDGMWKYSNPGFLIAGQVVSAATSVPYPQWLKDVVATKKISIAQSQRSAVAPSGEPLYHPGFPSIGKDAVFGTSGLVPTAYNQNTTARAAPGGWAMSAAALIRLMSLVDRPSGPLLSPATVKFWLLDDIGLPAVPTTDGGLIRPALGWDTYFTLTAQGGTYASEALTKNGRIAGATAVLSRRLSDAATLAVTANGDLIQGLRKADSFQTQHVDTLFSLVPPELDGDDLFSVLHPEWT